MKRWLAKIESFPRKNNQIVIPDLIGNLCKLLILSFVSLLCILYIYPSAFIYSKDTLPDNNDTRLIAYIIGQVQQNITKHQPLFYGTFFAPDKNTLAYSDPFITSAVFTLPFRMFTNSPIQIFNIALILGAILTIISSYLLFSYLFKDHWLATLSVILFNFSGYHFSYLPHLQMFSLWAMLLAIYFFLRFLNENKLVFLTLFFISVTLQMSESLFPVYLIFFTIVILLLSRPARSILAGEKPNSHNEQALIQSTYYRFPIWSGMTKQIKKIILHSLPFLPLWALLLFPYLQLHFSFPEATRPIRDAAAFSLGVDEIFTKYHSWTLIIIFLISIVALYSECRKQFRDEPGEAGVKVRRSLNLNTKIKSVDNKWVLASEYICWKIIFLFSLIMSLGPVLKIFGKNIRIFGLPIPLPYTLFYYLFPGFTGFRTPSRFIILTLLAAAILIGYWLKPVFAKLKSKTKLVFIIFILTLLFIEADLPLKAYPVNINMHPVYQEVKNLPKDATILELPIKLWNSLDHEIESIRSLYSLVHQHRRFNGFSGFATNKWIELTQKIEANGLNKENITALQSLGITHIIENNTLSHLPSPQ